MRTPVAHRNEHVELTFSRSKSLTQPTEDMNLAVLLLLPIMAAGFDSTLKAMKSIEKWSAMPSRNSFLDDLLLTLQFIVIIY